ncbi:hypothetical protein D3C81_1273760 [compost metagenome]
MRDIEQSAAKADSDQQRAPRAMRAVLERQRERDHAQRQQAAADPVKWRRHARLALRQVAAHREQAHQAHWHVDQEDPVP